MRNLIDMMGLDIYLSSLNEEKLKEAQKCIWPKKRYRPPLIGWDVYVNHYHNLLARIEKNTELETLEGLANEYKLDFNFDFILDKKYDALVFTSQDQTILWVSSGFKKMTGYSNSFAVGKKPNFLQGPNTSVETRRKIKQQLQYNKPFKEVIINYRKDQSEYACEIEVFPINGNQRETQAFLAIEREINHLSRV